MVTLFAAGVTAAFYFSISKPAPEPAKDGGHATKLGGGGTQIIAGSEGTRGEETTILEAAASFC